MIYMENNNNKGDDDKRRERARARIIMPWYNSLKKKVSGSALAEHGGRTHIFGPASRRCR